MATQKQPTQKLTFDLKPELYDQLKELAFQERASMSALVREALEALVSSRAGKKPRREK